MKKTLFLILLGISAITAYTQCDCYSVQGIELKSDTIMNVTFRNTCDNNVYLHGWVINSANDTLARFDECMCGFVLPLNQDVTWDFRSKVSTLPSLSTLRVSISNGTLVCASVSFASTLTLNESEDLSIKLYPNPVNDLLFWEGNLASIRIFSVLGEEVVRREQPSGAIDLSFLQRGIYYAEIKVDGGAEVRKKIVLE